MASSDFPQDVRDAVAMRSGGVCEVCGENPLAEVHHRRPRAMGGTRRASTNTAANALGVCRSCHHIIESHRTVARLLGWLVPQTTDPAGVPLMYRGRRVLLSENGSVRELEDTLILCNKCRRWARPPYRRGRCPDCMGVWVDGIKACCGDCDCYPCICPDVGDD